jgi:hypothetical protein
MINWYIDKVILMRYSGPGSRNLENDNGTLYESRKGFAKMISVQEIYGRKKFL